MGVNNNPPITISSSLDKATTSAYINENFRKISDSFNPLKISDGNFDRIIFGKYENGKYGIAYYDDNGNIVSVSDGSSGIYYDDNDARILIGKSPNGNMGIYVSKVGVDVVTELGG